MTWPGGSASAGSPSSPAAGPGSWRPRTAARRGRRACSVGLNIELPFEQDGNAYQDIALDVPLLLHAQADVRAYATAFVVFPGGFGTLDELFEALVLIQTRKIRSFPVVMVGVEHWSGLMAWMRARLATEAMIAPGDLDLMRCTDDPAEIVAIVEAGAQGQGV